MPRCRDIEGDNANGKLMGKLGKNYTNEHLQRLLQEFDVVFTKRDKKADLVAKLEKYVSDHMDLTKEDREEILGRPLDIQHIRWQVMDEDGKYNIRSYPPDLSDLLKQSAVYAVMDRDKDMVSRNARPCKGCKTMKGELEFHFASCCERKSTHCQGCIELSIRAKIDACLDQDDIICLMCDDVLSTADVQRVTTGETYAK